MIRDLVRRIEAEARGAGAERISCVVVWLGALSQMSEGHFREHFEEETRGTIAEGARLALEVSEDPIHADAQSVVLRSVDLEV